MPLPTVLEPETCVIFLGSGFSAEATNIAKSNPPVGVGLANEMKKLLDEDTDDLDLKSLSDELFFQDPDSLYQLLYGLFTITDVTDDQKTVLSKKWLRVFTTNYDDAIEVGTPGGPPPTFSYSDRIPKRIETGTVVHIHGDIRHANVDNVTEQLILNENSYIRQHFEKSPWYTDFDRALDHCSACFFIGYTLKDYHITSLLMQKPLRRDKTFFINRSPPVKGARRQMEQFGEIHPIGLSGFAALCKALPRPSPIADLNSLKSLRRVDPFRDKRPVTPPTPQEILRLVTYGEFNAQRCLTNLPLVKYVSPREKSAIEAMVELRKSKTLIIHSYLGNGKTIFLSILSYHLKREGFEVFECRNNSANLTRELQALSKLDKVVILFDSYELAISIVQHANNIIPEARFVVAVRSGEQEVRFHELLDQFPKPISRVGLNKLASEDKNEFGDILDKSGILDVDFKPSFNSSRDFRELVTTIYNHQGIRDRISAETKPLIADPETRDTFLASILMSWLGHSLEPSLLRSITNVDPFVALRKYEAVSREIFKIEEDSVEARSPIFSEYLLQNHCEPDQLLALIEKIIIAILPRKYERSLVGLVSKVMRISGLHALIRDNEGRELIYGMFGRLSRDLYVNKEPLFWLQYSILMTDKDIGMAEYYIKTAYARAADIETFKTYQLDTYHLKLLLTIESQINGDVSRYDEIISKLEIVIGMISDESHRSHAVKVLDGLPEFAAQRKLDLTKSETIGLVFQLNRVSTALDALPLEIKVETGSDLVRKLVERSISSLIT